MKTFYSAACVACGIFWIGAVSAQSPPASATGTKPLSTSLGLVVFPAKGQAADKQAADEGECFAWSKGQTGIDPFAPATAAAPPATEQAPPPKQGGQRLRGAARGAAAGAIVGEVANDDASEGAAIGATAGALKGGSDARRAKKESEQQAAAQAQQTAEQQKAAQGEKLAMFNKGFAACLEARNYTVK